jgi:hypothetical protein
MKVNRFTRGNASRFFVAGELSRRGYPAVVTSGKSPNTHVLCSNAEGTKTVHILVRTYVPGSSSCAVGVKAEQFSGDNYFWILAGIPYPGGPGDFEYYVIPNRVMAENEPKYHRRWLETPGRNDRAHQDTNMRVVLLPPSTSPYYWDISQYRNNWGIIEDKLS